ncbi:microtubule-associated tumor suppressor candidate 2 isoform X2 [Cololabis saira]|uniref:microtubule-associated tumor suppressor candidate 2 isoform X2 n=1 Tax=Cololabis saira TaxID=129043 RepID=UPI002AD2BD85|nr:microtubule-associated tumor suppressor candidate 2 isoform X2 [Cololabis saira]
MCDRGEPFGDGELRNNNQGGGMVAGGDANANDIETEDAGRTGDSGSLSGPLTVTAEQDRVVIWGTDSQCDDPDLAEFEMLECQELEAYLVEDGEDFVGIAEREELQEQEHQHATGSGVSENKETSRTELSSETDVFVTCLSNISSIAMATPMTDSGHVACGSHVTLSEDLTLASQTCGTISERERDSQRDDPPSLLSRKSTTHQKDLDLNLNSTLPSEDDASQAQGSDGVVDEHKENNNQRNEADEGGCDYTEQPDSSSAKKSSDESNSKMDKSTQADETPPAKTDTKATQSTTEYKAIKKQGSFDNTLKTQNAFDKAYKKQPSFENSFKKQLSFDNSLRKPGSLENTTASTSSSLERRKPWGNPGRPATPTSPKTTSCSPKRRPPGSPARVQGGRALSLERANSPQRGTSPSHRPTGKTNLNSGIPKPVIPQQKEADASRPLPPQKPKNVRPKIITYVRKNTQARPQDADHPHETSTNPARLTSYSGAPAHKDSKVVPQSRSAPVLSTSNLLYDKYRQEMQKAGYYSPGTAATGPKPPGSAGPQRVGGKSESFHEEMSMKYLQEDVSQEGRVVYRPTRTLRPQLGLGAVTRQPAAKTRLQQTGQKSAPASCQSALAARTSIPGQQDLGGEQRKSGTETSPKSLLLKSGQSGLRAPGFSALPATRLAAFGFVRSSSVSSVSSNQSSDSSQNEPCRPSQHPSGGSDHTPLDKAPPAQTRPQPPNAPSLHRRSLPPQRCSPLAQRRELQKDAEATLSPKSSPKRFAVISPKPQSPARGQTTAVHGAIRTIRAQELDRALIQQLQERCEQQDLQLQSLQAQLKKASLCLDVFSITTQHFCHKSESAIVKERELSLELARIRDEVAFSVAHWEQLQQEKEGLERRFEAELQGLQAQQQRELGALEERLRARHADETENLQARQRAELEELRLTQREQLEEMGENHEASLMEMETTHNDTLATLQEEHARTIKNLKMAHEQQKKSLEEEFHKIRLSLQDQVDTLTFQNRSLRDRAKRFEEALRKSTDEQIVDALAPYKHIEEDLKSLKDVLEMKNQQIHQQDLKISELEKIAEKNVYLEERVQVLQQQNEDLKERIDKNLAVSRHLSEENANLQVNVEKESNEKKRLSRTNEELMWRLQTGELSPRMSPSASPIHRPLSGPGSPARPHSYHQ